MGTHRQGGSKKTGRVGLLILASLVSIPRLASGVERLRFKPGFNLFSPKQDIQVGHEASADVEKKLPLVTDPEVTRYVNDLGRRLAEAAPNKSEYPWTFKVVNSKEINAFALPGGFIYVNRGAIEAAEGEAEIAGVMAHEIGHVVMRHGTHQASQIMLAQAPLAILGGLLGQSSTLTSQLAQMGISFGVNSLLLKNSRSAEAQADEVGTYTLYQAGYDPRAMAEFFEIIEKKYPQRTLEFFSDHPNPENRIKKVDALIPELGPPRGGKTSNPEFQTAKKRLLDMPAPPKGKPAPRSASSSISPPAPPSARLVRYRDESFAIDYPDNWQVQKSENSVTLAPPGGILDGSEDGPAQAYGASITRYQPANRTQTGWGLIDATAQLVESMRQSNPNLRVIRQTGLTIKGSPALSTLLENDSPIEGQKEQDRLVTLRADGKMLAVVFIAPQTSVDAYQPTFEAMLRSFEIRQAERTVVSNE